MKHAALILMILISQTPVSDDTAASEEFIIWNVGQGLWATQVDANSCRHFDMGGERAPWRQIQARCRAKRNVLRLSHLDWDHIGFSRRALHKLNSLCLERRTSMSESSVKTRFLAALPLCEPSADLEIKTIYEGHDERSANDRSRVQILRKWALLPGDSTRNAERRWIRYLKALDQPKLLVLGHHGSRTSTSIDLLRKITSARQAIASARFVRYNHPHPEVARRLKEAGIALLRTEDWGHLVFEAPPNLVKDH